MAARAVNIVGAMRTPLGRGKANAGHLSSQHPVEMLAKVLSAATQSARVDKEDVEDVVAGCVTPIGEQGANVGRLATLKAGFPFTVPGIQINRMCGSGQQAVHFASQAIAAGDMDVAIGCGVESMSRIQMGSDTDLFSKTPTEFKKNFPYKLIHQGISAELVAEKYGITKEACDEFAARSHELCAAARDAGRFKSQILPMTVPNPANPEETVEFDWDEGVRAPVDMAKLASLKTIFKEGGVVTAGNASQITDGAAAVVLASDKAVEEYELTPRARIVARVVVGSDPVVMLDGVIPATVEVLHKAGLEAKDIDLFEINEAFASVALAWQSNLGVDMDKVNIYGGAIAHGHPLGATGAVLMTKLVNALEDQDKRYGLQTMCIGHGMATATIIERV